MSSTAARLDAVELALVVAEACLYGIFLVFLGGVSQTVHSRWKRNGRFILLLCMTVYFFCMITAHLFLDVARAFDAFIYLQGNDTTADTPITDGDTVASEYFKNLGLPKYLATSAIYGFTTTAGDAFMVYRLYIVWNRNWMLIVIPVLMVMGTFGLTILGAVNFSRFQSQSIFASEGAQIAAFFALTTATNLFACGLIAYKVWRSKNTVAKLGVQQSSKLRRIIHVLIQSAALYSISTILSLAFYLRKSNIQFLFTAINTPIIGIVFAMITSGTVVSIQQNPTGHSTYPRPLGTNNSTPLEPLSIRITTEIGLETEDHKALSPSGSKSASPGDYADEVHKYPTRLSFEAS